ncbi:hypothetical protein PRELSG_API05400 (apicoplast) [Plasmodium relictum]|uniref:Uncharacterized protein n=1 Tax=Plasmodium relictum TaxID=85471 RepID=A0A1J1HBU0_PLARL|nr:hypothetical protein PRELSG_API05400 [Plasmodium relictum]CRH02969.1 hypothetical protein PRELSG_API05400 [Plasmodium relictum]
MKINIIKYYYKNNSKKLFKNKNINNIILNNIFLIKLNFYEYINKKLQIYNFKGILLKNKKNNNILILKYNNNDILFLYFYLNIYNLINIYKLGIFNITRIKYLL